MSDAGTSSARVRQGAEVTGAQVPRVFDQESLLSRVEGSWEYLELVMAEFLVDCPARIASLPGMVRAGDAVAIQRVAHALRGSSATVGADVIREEATALELAAGQSRGGEMAEIIESLTRCFDEFRLVVEAAISAAHDKPRSIN